MNSTGTAFRPATGRPPWRRRGRGPLLRGHVLRGHDPQVVLVAIASALLIGTRQAFTVPFTGLGLSPAQLIFFLLLLVWLATRIAGGRSGTSLGVLSVVMLVRLCLLLISYSRAVTGVLDPDQRVALNHIVPTEFAAAGVVLVLACLLRSRRDVELVARGLVIGGAVNGLFGLVQYGTGVDLAARVRLPGLHDSGQSVAELLRLGAVRSQGASSVPLELGAVLTALLPIGLALVFLAHRRGGRWWLWAIACLLIAGGALASVSRVVFVGSLVALVVMATRWSRRRTGAVVAVLVVGGGAALASGASVVDTLTTVVRSGSDDNSLASRSNGRQYVWTHFAEHFWFGQGPGTYDLTKQPILDNQYLGQLMETGALGLLFFAGILLVAFGYALRATGRDLAPDDRDLAIGIAGSLAAVVVDTSVIDTEGFIQIFSLTWLLIGLAGAIWRVSVADSRPPRPVGTADGAPAH